MSHTFDTNSDPSLFLEREGGDGSPQRLPAGSTVLVRAHPSGDPLASTQALALGYLSFDPGVDAVKVSGDNGATWKGPFYSQELREATATGTGAGADLLDPSTGLIKSSYLPAYPTGNYASLDPDTGLISASVVPPLNYDAAGAASAVQTDLDTFKPQTASNEDLLWCWYSGQAYGTVDVAPDFVVGPAPMDLTLLGASFVWDDSNNYTGTPGSDTSWYQVALAIAGGSTLVYQTTQLTGADAGGGITPERAWNFDARTWSSRNMTKGQVLKVVFSRGATGTNAKPTNIGIEFGLVLRYQRQATA